MSRDEFGQEIGPKSVRLTENLGELTGLKTDSNRPIQCHKDSREKHNSGCIVTTLPSTLLPVGIEPRPLAWEEDTLLTRPLHTLLQDDGHNKVYGVVPMASWIGTSPRT